MACRYRCNAQKKVFIEALGRFVDCPECRNITKVLEEPQGDGTSMYDKLRIPPQYKNFGVSGIELFNPQGLSAFTAQSINDVSNLLERINKDLYSGSVTSVSAYIHTTNMVDIKRFVYGAQKLAIENNLGVTPMISCNTLFGLQKVGDYNLRTLQEVNTKQGELKEIPPDLISAVDGYRLVQATDLTYFDFIHADLCFIEATANTTEKGWTGLADLLGERSKQGLPTFVIGYWGTKGGAWTGSRGLKYLLAPEHGTVRLDLLVPFELKGKTSNGGDEAHVNRILNLEIGKSDVSAGLSVDTLMRS